MADTELSNKNQTSITHNITDIPEVTDKLTPKLPDAAIINYDDGTTSRIPINWLLINNSNVGSINISNNNYLFDYSIKDSFNKTNIVTVNIVVTVVNPEGYLNNSSTKNTNFVNKNNTPKRYNTFKTQSLNQNKLSTVPKTYDYSVTILTLTLFIFSFSCMVVLNFKKSK